MFELNYMLMQSYDFMVMARDFDVKIEFGGNDQWSNIIGGVDLTRKKTGKEVYGMTFSLLTNCISPCTSQNRLQASTPTL